MHRTKKKCPAPSQPAGMCPDRPHAAHAPAAQQPAFSARLFGSGLELLQASQACNLHGLVIQERINGTSDQMPPVKCARGQLGVQGASSTQLASPAQTRHRAAVWLNQLCGGVWRIKRAQEVERPPQLCRCPPPGPTLLLRHQLNHLQVRTPPIENWYTC